MPQRGYKRKLIDVIIYEAFLDLDNGTDDDDEILDTAIEEVHILLENRYSVPRLPIIKSNDWWSKIVPRYDDNQFKHEFRVKREDFDKILGLIKHDPIFTKRQFNVEYQLAVALSRFGEYGSASSLAKKSMKFALGLGTVIKITRRVIQAILRLKATCITWPNENKRREICEMMETKLPNCVGYMDGTEIKLDETPIDDHESYYSRKQNYAIKVQAVVDNDRRILDVVIGYPGSVHDARIFVNSNIFQNFSRYLTDGQWLAADSAYSISQYVVTPFRKNAKISENERILFQQIFSKYRVKVEHAFGIMKEVFGSLKELRIRVCKKKGHKLACEWILACCILYNIILPDPEDYDIDLNDLFSDLSEECDIVANVGSGDEKRLQILQWMINHYGE